jgi:transcriptional regulator with XRE-family HTH domain
MDKMPVREKMTPDELRLAGVSLFGDEPGWQRKLAEVMGYDRSAVTRWLSGAVPIPMHASLLVQYMIIFGLPKDSA